VGHLAEDERRAATAQDDVVLRGHLQQDPLDRRHVMTVARPETLDEARLLLGDVDELQHAFAKAFGRGGDDLAIGEPVPESLRKLAPDIIPLTSEDLRDRDDTHGLSS
jgi:hypothetical protein